MMSCYICECLIYSSLYHNFITQRMTKYFKQIGKLLSHKKLKRNSSEKFKFSHSHKHVSQCCFFFFFKEKALTSHLVRSVGYNNLKILLEVSSLLFGEHMNFVDSMCKSGAP